MVIGTGTSYREISTSREVGPPSLTHASLPLNQLKLALPKLELYIRNHVRGINSTLYERQLTVFEDLLSYLESGKTSGYIKLPTGTGKTVIFCEFIEAVQQRSLIVVPTRILVSQTKARLNQFAPNIRCGLLYGEQKQKDADVIITTYPYFVRAYNRGEIQPKDFDWLILDEAQEGLGTKRREVISKFLEHCCTLGFTATPEYHSQKTVASLLGEEIHSMGVKEAVELGMQCPFSTILAETDIDLTGVPIRHGDFGKAQLERAINQQVLNEAAVNLYKQEFLGKTVVAFCAGVKQAEALCKLFNEHNVPATTVTGADNKSEREAKIKSFLEGKTLVICNARVLTFGFDDPRISVCFNVAPTLSPVLAEQRSGRALRIDPNNPEKHAVIVDFLYKRNRQSSLGVTFAKLVNEAQVLGPVKRTNVGGGGHKVFVVSRETPFIKGLKLICNPSEVMNIAKASLVDAPAGWQTRGQVAKENNTTDWIVNKIANQHRESHPEWFAAFRSLKGRGNVLEHYSPELILLIKKELKKLAFLAEAFAQSGEEEKVHETESYVSKAVRQLSQEEKYSAFKKCQKSWIKLYKILCNMPLTLVVFHDEILKRKEEVAAAEAPPIPLPISITSRESAIGQRIDKLNQIVKMLSSARTEKKKRSTQRELRSWISSTEKFLKSLDWQNTCLLPAVLARLHKILEGDIDNTTARLCGAKDKTSKASVRNKLEQIFGLYDVFQSNRNILFYHFLPNIISATERQPYTVPTYGEDLVQEGFLIFDRALKVDLKYAHRILTHVLIHLRGKSKAVIDITDKEVTNEERRLRHITEGTIDDRSIPERSEEIDPEEYLRTRFPMLNEQERKVIDLRFGIGQDQALGLKGTAQTIGISKERVRQIQNKALLKLKDASVWTADINRVWKEVMGIIRVGKAMQDRLILPEDYRMIFGVEDIGEVTPFPKYLTLEFLNSDSIIVPGKRVRDITRLVYVPSHIGGRIFTMEELRLQAMTINPRLNCGDIFCNEDQFEGQLFFRKSLREGTWFLMLEDVLPNTVNRSYDHNMSYFESSSFLRAPPSLALLTMLVMTSLKTGERPYANYYGLCDDRGWYRRDTHVSAKKDFWTTAIRNNKTNGINVSAFTKEEKYPYLGWAGCLNF